VRETCKGMDFSLVRWVWVDQIWIGEWVKRVVVSDLNDVIDIVISNLAGLNQLVIDHNPSIDHHFDI
jgi:hypothetical protein